MVRKLLFQLIATYASHTPPHPGRGILARWAYKVYPEVFIGGAPPDLYGGQDELRAFLEHLREGMTVMDIGANIGIYALHFARKVGLTGRVYAFEPVPEFFEWLKEHIALNKATNIIPVPVALSNQKGTAKMSMAGEGSSIFLRLTNRFVEVPMVTLDEFITEHRIDRVDAIKIDVEGAELHVIQGAEQTIRRFKPIMMVELNDTTLKAAGTSPEELFQTIVSYGYKAFVIRNGKAIPVNKVVRPFGVGCRSMAVKKFFSLLSFAHHFQELDNYLFLPREA